MQQLVSPEVLLCDIISCHMIFLQNINKMAPWIVVYIYIYIYIYLHSEDYAVFLYIWLLYTMYSDQNYKRNSFVFAPIFHELNSKI